MNSSDLPSRILKAFAVNGNKNTIDVDSTPATLNNGTATFDSGFPPVTMQPISAGGLPPSGRDMNGLLYSVTLQQQWYNAGMTYPYNAEFSTNISGYPRGAIVPRTDFTGQWLNINEGNANSPESPVGANTGWVPLNNYGVTQISGLSNSSVTMSSLQAAKDRIILSGNLTGNINLIFPAWIKSWIVHNNCSGNFTVTCRTAAGTGFVATQGLVSRLFCDGINITDETLNTNNDMTGFIGEFSGDNPPQGWLLANGLAVSRVTYARLFAVIGTKYGSGNGTTTFNLPDPRGLFPRYADLGKGVDSGRVIGSVQQDAIRNITGTVDILGRPVTPTGVFSVSDSAPAQVSGSTVGVNHETLRLNAADLVPTASENRPKNISWLPCIKY
ncbi:phage tail protein [Pectobacterium brasiliense]|uniref:phage tail protein n=1 Tax=Pectobacterium brasiliense TaxID=180957 RepID=UPI000B979426|nr:phage tail protein [Pectobacterium carotovorum]OYN49475.1 phage tail protein [Pectobacterium carotovorum]